MIALSAGQLDEIVVIGAHCDDIAIGMGGTLLTIARSNPGIRVTAIVMSGAGTEREAEERAALAAFCPAAELEVRIGDLPDGRLPTRWADAKAVLAQASKDTSPDVVFAPQRHDAHQDHRLIAEVTPTEFRDHLILGYEIIKWESDLPSPTHYSTFDSAVAQAKAELLTKHYPSQVGRDWFDEATFLGLSRIRGVQSRSPHAEGFVVDKVLLSFGRNHD